MESGKPESADALSLDPYRYLFRKDPYLEDAKTYADERVRKSAAGFALGAPTVRITPVSDFLGRRHIEVRIKGNFRVLMHDVFAVDLFNLSRAFDYEVYGYADCVDLLDYLNTVEYVEWVAGGGSVKSKTVNFIDGVLEFAGKFL